MADSLSARQRRLYARHLLLPQIGTAGQQRLCASRFACAPAAEPRAAGVAAEYLRRAGLTEASDDAEGATPAPLELPEPAVVARLAGDPALAPAAAALAGAFAAVETIKAAVGTGQPARLPAGLRLSDEPDGTER